MAFEILRAALRGEEVRLDAAALDLAAIEYPGLDPAPFLEILDSMGRELAARIHDLSDGLEFVEKTNAYLYQELGFQGNTEDYYDVRNSCLNEVLARRTGIPISLAVVYLELGRRLAMPMFGIGLPGHFIIEYNDGRFSALLDPFHGGRMVTSAEALELARRITARPLDDPSVFARVSRKQLLGRMLENLRGIYTRAGNDEKALATLRLLLEGNPEWAEGYRQAGIAGVRTGQLVEAKEDFENFLRLDPASPMRQTVIRQIEAITRYLAKVN
ncbi:MAG: transglutaminase-like domain-containing protein [Bryobacteraceae bacterium]|nr:transglutaminase-like domain-containing protein [Bryobacteraceae bacterium]